MAEDGCFQTAELLLEPHRKETDMGALQQEHSLFFATKLEANPILPAGKHEAFSSLFKERFSSPGSTNYATKGTGVLPKLGNMTPSSTRYGRLTVAYGNSWRFGGNAKQPNDGASQDIYPTSSESKELTKMQHIPPDYVLPAELEEFVLTSPHEFQCVMKKGSKLVYLRLNNSCLNYFSKSGRRFYSSLFFDCKALLTERPQKKPFDLFAYFQAKYPSLPRQVQDNEWLQFDSNFEGGNLFSVHKVSDREFNIFMQNDTNTKGSTQWFHFSASNRHRCKVRFNIVNFYKQSSLYDRGMKPLVYSTQRAKHFKDDNWRRAGQAVQYEQTLSVEGVNYYRLSFTYDFEYLEDTVYFAYSFPYTYSDLRKYLDRLAQVAQTSRLLKRTVLCRTLLNYNVYLLEITNPKQPRSQRRSKKEIVYILGRQHAGESPASFVMEGVINTLLSSRVESCELRDRFIFKVVPMVNPDGVVLGNYRTNLSGSDVNRKWDFPTKAIHPEVFHIKRKLAEDRKEVRFFLDLHAHSRKMNSFFYGSPLEREEHKLFPFVCSRLSKDISFEDSSYWQDQSKRSTARIVTQMDLGVRKCYTFETSFYGRQRDGNRQHFQKADLKALGETLVLGLYYSEVKLRSMSDPLGSRQPEDTPSPFAREESKSNADRSLNPRAANSEESKTAAQSKMLGARAKNLQAIDQIVHELFEKWRKELIRSIRKDESDMGSDSQPEQFLLKDMEVEQFEQFTDHEVIKDIDKIQEAADEANSQEQSSQRRQGGRDTPIPRTHMHKNSNLTNHAVVKQLECELQLLKRRHREQQESQLNEPRVQRVYMSLDPNNKKQRNYRENITELKRTLRFMMDDSSFVKNSMYNRYFSSNAEKQLNSEPMEASKSFSRHPAQRNIVPSPIAQERRT